MQKNFLIKRLFHYEQNSLLSIEAMMQVMIVYIVLLQDNEAENSLI